ncbi:hypothetical protein [Candidatus Halocynthiibacter alkanivorans]|uniref:hypothetical protein n=1 Tax=Candidatus Halocynthiibacter alkanivorans TaxID=2267619 RepID=UPI00109CA158|nr:hypothetical protein [Candidatus Halocynthiibacter alkanivorans]
MGYGNCPVPAGDRDCRAIARQPGSFFDMRKFGTLIQVNSLERVLIESGRVAGFGISLQFFALLIGVVAMTILVGQHVALPLFVFYYLARWGGYSLKISLAYGAATAILIYGFYDKLMNLYFYPSLLFG